jgi:hypothetical protein
MDAQEGYRARELPDSSSIEATEKPRENEKHLAVAWLFSPLNRNVARPRPIIHDNV